MHLYTTSRCAVTVCRCLHRTTLHRTALDRNRRSRRGPFEGTHSRTELHGTGKAGSGKTILSLHVLATGLDADETGLFINLEVNVDDLKANAASLGFDTSAIEFLDLSPGADVFTEDQSYEVFAPEAVEVPKFHGSSTQSSDHAHRVTGAGDRE